MTLAGFGDCNKHVQLIINYYSVAAALATPPPPNPPSSLDLNLTESGNINTFSKLTKNISFHYLLLYSTLFIKD